MRINYFLDKQSDQPLYLQLYQQMKNAIYQQQFALGEKLPSKRRLCEHLQISQNTLETAYQQLLAEGYIESRPRSGFFVCFQPELNFRQSAEKFEQKQTPRAKVQFDLNPNQIDRANFPSKIWKKCGGKNKTFFTPELLQLGDAQGDEFLRQQIATYLAASRGVDCSPEQIVIAAGVEGCLQQLVLLFNKLYGADFTYAMEPHGYAKVAQLLALYDKTVSHIPMDLATGELTLSKLNEQVNVAYVTPSNIYPFGRVLSINQRQSLLEWANSAADRYIIEDDYDSEFRYKGKPIPALQSLDDHKVIYLGSFSKLIMPSLRISFMVLPLQLLAKYQQHCAFFHSSVSRFEQQRLSNFIQQGELEKHINRMRKIYRRKMELVCSLLTPYRAQIRYYGENSGFYLLIELLKTEQKTLPKSTALYEQALAAEVKVYPVEIGERALFVLGFADLSEEQIREGILRLLMAWQVKKLR